MITTTVETITPSKAKEYLLWNKQNRPVDKKTVQLYARDMKEGRWTLSNDAITFFDNHILGNGQHRLYAIIESDTACQFIVVRNLPSETFTNLDQGKKRTAADCLSIEEIPNPVPIASIIRKYCAFNGTTARGFRMSTSQTLEIYKEHADFFQEAYKFMATIYRACRVMNISIFGGMYAYLILDKHHTPENVTRFIKECAGVEPNTNSNTPQLLRSALIADVSSKVKTMTEIYKIGLITKAWNNWVQKREIVLLKISGQEKNLKFI